MKLSWSDIAMDDSCIDLGINLLDSEKSSSPLFEEFVSKANALGIDKRVSFKFICLMISVMGGLQIYLPKEDSFKSLIAYRMIYKEFTGSNANELASKYDLSVQAIGRIVKACRTADKKARDSIAGLK